MNQSLHALVINLIAQNAGTLPGSVGELAHAAFYAAVQAVDPALSARMHDAQERKAFSLSPLYGYWQSPQDKRIHVNTGQAGWLRLGLLDEELFAVFMQHILYSGLTGGAPTIRLGNVDFAIREVQGSPGSHPWSGYITVADLAALDATSTRWVLEFASPTAIRWEQADNGTRKVEIFPQPRLAMASLRSRWDKMTGDQYGKEFEEWVGRNVVVGRVWNWETEPFAYKRQSYIGGTGQLQYVLLDSSNQSYTAHFNRLLHLAFFAGIGYKTTHGMGQVRVISP
ncbi:MAG: CRISPR-associated endoribonuclease Cas6 [Caldilineaceae bacterium]|nr:CRISPR-associated endoribonuclease Cas6 [Caldilineaceae bacterium]